MFTGLVEAVGEVIEVKPTSGGARIRIRTTLAPELTPGDSLAVNGVCLTVIAAAEGDVHADVGPETLRVTALGGLDRGAFVNLERPLRADGRFGGHFVQGHVDGVGTLVSLRRDAEGAGGVALQRVLENAVVYDLMNPPRARSRGPNNLSWYLGRSRGG